MAYMDQVDCPACGHRFYRSADEPWKAQLGKFLAVFCEMATPIETRHLMQAGEELQLWVSQSTGQRRVHQLVREGYIVSPTHGWWNLTDKGVAFGRDWAGAHPTAIPVIDGITDGTSIPGPSVPGRRDSEDRVREPSDWQLHFMKKFVYNSGTLVSIPAVHRWARKEGWLRGDEARSGITGIRTLIADGWLGWAGKYLALTEPAKRMLIRKGEQLPENLPVVEPIRHERPTRVPNPWDNKESHPLADVHKK